MFSKNEVLFGFLVFSLVFSCSRLGQDGRPNNKPGITSSKKFIGDYVPLLEEDDIRKIGTSKIMHVEAYVDGKKVEPLNFSALALKIGYGTKNVSLVISTPEGKKFIMKKITVENPGFKFQEVKYSFDYERRSYIINLKMGKDNLNFDVKSDFPLSFEVTPQGKGEYSISINSDFAGPIDIYASDGRYTKLFSIDLSELFDDEEIMIKYNEEIEEEEEEEKREYYRILPLSFLEPKGTKTAKIWRKYFTVRRVVIGEYEFEDATIAIKPLRFAYSCPIINEIFDPSKCGRVFNIVRMEGIDESIGKIALCAISQHFVVNFHDGNSVIENFEYNNTPSVQVKIVDFGVENKKVPCFLHEFQNEITIENFYENAAFNIIDTAERGMRTFRGKVASRVRVYYHGQGEEIEVGPIKFNVNAMGFARKFRKDIVEPAKDKKNENGSITYGKKHKIYFYPYLKEVIYQ